MRSLLQSIGVVFIGAISYIIYSSGITANVVLERGEFKKLRIAYLKSVGPYSESWKLGALVESKLATVMPIEWSKEPCIGIYYDNPEIVPVSECRSIYGKVIPEDLQLDGTGIETAHIETMPDAIQIRYPLRGFLSILCGMRRAYPMIHAFWETAEEAKGTAIAELYGFNGSVITYLQGVGEYKGIMTEWPM